MADTQKQTTITLKPEKTNPKNTIFHVQKQPTIFHKFSVFQHTVFVFEKLCFAENTIKIVLSETQPFKNTVSKTQFFNHVKNTFFKKKVSFLVLANFRWNPYFYSVSWFTLFWSKNIFGQNR